MDVLPPNHYLFIFLFILCFDMFADGCLSHLTGVAAGLLGVYLRWLLYPHKQQLNNQVKMEMKQYQDPQQISQEIYNSDNIGFLRCSHAIGQYSSQGGYVKQITPDLSTVHVFEPLVLNTPPKNQASPKNTCPESKI